MNIFGLNKSWFKKNLANILEKVITIPWTIWTHRNNSVFKGDKCNPTFAFELAKKIAYEVRDYKKYTNLLTSSKVVDMINQMQVEVTFNKLGLLQQAG